VTLPGLAPIESTPEICKVHGSMPSVSEAPQKQTADDRTGFVDWVRREPMQALLLALIAGVLVYFFGFYRVFMNGAQSAVEWTYKGWNEENDQVHCWAIAPAMLFILWLRRNDLRTVVKAPSARGLFFIAAGILSYIISVRCLQARFSIVAAPLIVYGTAEFLGGRAFARIFIFPCLLFLFMIPVGGIVQSTVSLQLMASGAVGKICSLLGIHVQITGTKIDVNGHPYEVAGGCSGIRSLMAMTLLSALYVYFTQRELWKRWLIFGCSILFAVVGNIARLLSVVLAAKWWDPEIAGGSFHDFVGFFVFFPSAVLVMVAFSNLLNRDWSNAGAHIKKTLNAPDTERPASTEAAAASDDETGEGKKKPASLISYDY